MSAPNLETLQHSCEAIRAGGTSTLRWSWDDRFKAILVQIDATQAPSFHALLEKEIPTFWSAKTIKQAPPSVQTIVKSMGGLESKQEIFATNPEEPAFLLVAWWPWQSGAQFSVRLLLRTDTPAGADLDLKLREWFGV